MSTELHAKPLLITVPGVYRVRLASSESEVQAAQALRFKVFNLELNEGLGSSFATGLDADRFDTVCDHLLVEHLPTGEVVGTYRLQTGATAARRLGYYSEQEFDFTPFESSRDRMIELGRACVHREHRTLIVLGLLWKGIAVYARNHEARFLVGCSSITSQDPTEGAAIYSHLCRRHLAPVHWQTVPRPEFECALNQLHPDPPRVPKLLRAYLSIGAWIAGPPALDRQFRTIDLLTVLDLDCLPAAARGRFFG